jgi:hypothetical protein
MDNLIGSLRCLWNVKTLVGAAFIAFVEAIKYVILKWMVK